MGSNVSLTSISLTTFEILNEIFISIGAGVLGLILLTQQGIKTNNFVQSFFISSITVASLLYVFRTKECIKPSADKLVFITGCDSGLGFSLAQHACEMGFTVLAGCLKLDSEGAKELRNLFGKKIFHIEIDITRTTSIEVAVDVVEAIIKRNPQYRLWAIINNAGVMVFGEFEWLTQSLIDQQVNVNLLGTFQLTKSFCPLLRKHRGRIITISSHCALSTLPGLSVYGATKAGLLAWSDGLRVELGKYGIGVVTFIPGSFATQSNIMARQKEYSLEMLGNFTPEQNRFYGDYFKRYNAYLNLLAGSRTLQKIPDLGMYHKFEQALLEVAPKAVYINEPFRYSVYHTFFRYSPVFIRDYLINRFMQMPQYENRSSTVEIIV